METKGEEKLGTADHIVRVREGLKKYIKTCGKKNFLTYLKRYILGFHNSIFTISRRKSTPSNGGLNRKFKFFKPFH